MHEQTRSIWSNTCNKPLVQANYTMITKQWTIVKKNPSFKGPVVFFPERHFSLELKQYLGVLSNFIAKPFYRDLMCDSDDIILANQTHTQMKRQVDHFCHLLVHVYSILVTYNYYIFTMQNVQSVSVLKHEYMPHAIV